MEDLANYWNLTASDPVFWMPLVLIFFVFLLILASTLLNGVDLGVGVLVLWAPASERNRLMAMLSPWRDANECWLLLGTALFFAAFPLGWGVIMSQLYGSLTIMLMGVLLRSVAFEFRLRGTRLSQPRWLLGFWLGSVLNAVGQGMILGHIATNFQNRASYDVHAVLIGLGTIAAYALLGAGWLVLREQGPLQQWACVWMRRLVRWAAAAMMALSLSMGLFNPTVFYKWSNRAHLSLSILLWSSMLLCFIGMEMLLMRLPHRAQRWAWLPCCLCIVLWVATLSALAFSLFPYLTLNNLTIWSAAASVDSLRLVWAGVAVGIPVVLIFNMMTYRKLFCREKMNSKLARV